MKTGSGKARFFYEGTAQAMLGKVNLFQEEWPNAVTQFESVISSDEYELEPSVAGVFSAAGEFGVESF